MAGHQPLAWSQLLAGGCASGRAGVDLGSDQPQRGPDVEEARLDALATLEAAPPTPALRVVEAPAAAH
jgi:hypothetical protein